MRKQEFAKLLIDFAKIVFVGLILAGITKNFNIGNPWVTFVGGLFFLSLVMLGLYNLKK